MDSGEKLVWVVMLVFCWGDGGFGGENRFGLVLVVLLEWELDYICDIEMFL